MPLLSHDDASPEQRAAFRALGCRVSEFPMNVATAQAAAAAGDAIVLGAPNVMRGKSHLGWIDATTMVARALPRMLTATKAEDIKRCTPRMRPTAATGTVPVAASVDTRTTIAEPATPAPPLDVTSRMPSNSG